MRRARCAPQPTPSHPAARGIERGGSDTNSQTSYELLCPAGTLVTAITGRQSPYANVVGPLTCSNGATTGVSSSSTSGTTFNIASTSYFQGFPTVYSGLVLDRFVYRLGTDEEGWLGASTVNMAGAGPSLCPPGSFLAGVYGRSGTTYLTTIGPICRAVGAGHGVLFGCKGVSCLQAAHGHGYMRARLWYTCTPPADGVQAGRPARRGVLLRTYMRAHARTHARTCMHTCMAAHA